MTEGWKGEGVHILDKFLYHLKVLLTCFSQVVFSAFLQGLPQGVREGGQARDKEKGEINQIEKYLE